LLRTKKKGEEMVDFILAISLLAIVGVAVVYIIKAKKSGTKCIGFPCGTNCGKCQGSCSGQSPDE